MSDDQLGQLNDGFQDLVAKGEIVKTQPLRQEKDEPELLSKPRITFRYNHQSAGRLHQMILAINQMGHSL